MTNKPRLLTGDRPTGRLHLGHYVGSLANRVRLQHQYESFFIIADLHTLTTKPEPNFIKEIPTFIKETVLDYLAVGIDPNVSTIFVQSAIPETYQLNLLFEMLVTVPRLERIPSLKDMARDANMETMLFRSVATISRMLNLRVKWQDDSITYTAKCSQNLMPLLVMCLCWSVRMVKAR
jgi:tryptophanyl-tRNA synthetase